MPRATQAAPAAFTLFLAFLWASLGPCRAQTPPQSPKAPPGMENHPLYRPLPKPPAPPPLSAAEQAAFDRDVVRLADFHVESTREKLLNLPKDGQAARDREAAAMFAKWRDKSPLWENRLREAAGERALPRIRELQAKHGPRMQETWLEGVISGVEWTIRSMLVFLTNPRFYLSIFGGLLAFWIFKALRRKEEQAAPVLPELSDNFGSARYAELRTDMPDPYHISGGVFFGKSSAPEHDKKHPSAWQGAPVCSVPEAHTLIVARTRTGKGTRVIVPTLLRYAGSCLVIDPKGENAAITARIRHGIAGRDVHILNPWGELAKTFEGMGFTPATYNPLDVLDRNDPNVVAVAQGLAAAVCPTAPGDKDKYWQGSAANVLTAVLLWITDQPGETKTLARAREIVSLSRKDFTDGFLVKMAASAAFDGAIREMVSPYLDLAQETYSGIMSNLSEATKFLSDPRTKAVTAASSFSMTDLIERPVTVYLVIPPDRIDTQRTWLRLVTAAAMHTFKRYPLHGRSPHRCMMLMDEFPALGRIEDMPRDIATVAGYGIDFTLIVQGIDQLKDLYGPAAGTLLSNCAFKWFCNVNDLESAKYLSDALGKTTVRTKGVGQSHNEGPGGAGQSESVNYGETGRPLLMPDEIMNLGRDVAIVLNPIDHPHYLRPVDYWGLPDAFAHLKENYPHLYWQPPLAYDENPYYRKKPPQQPQNGKMSREDALAILGLTEGATPEEIHAAWKRLMQKVHPDIGGSNRLAQMLSEAKDVLTNAR